MNTSSDIKKMSMFVVSLVVCSLLITSQTGLADSATWRSNPSSGDWNTAGNWTPMTVPNGPNDTATFQASSQTGLSISANIQVGAIYFGPGAGPFVIAGGPSTKLTITGTGITNDSGLAQRFYTVGVIFSNSASAGSATFSTSNVSFYGSSTADNATFNNAASFYDFSSAASGTFNGQACFFGHSTVNNATFNGSACFSDFTTADDRTVNGGATFGSSATAGNATINGGATFTGNSAAMTATLSGGTSFSGNSTGDTARVIGNLDISGHAAPGVAVGSIEGSGNVLLGFNRLTVGTNNVSTTFSGTMSGSGSLTKAGTGVLTLNNSNTNGGATIISSGILRASADHALGNSPQNFGYVSVESGATLTLDSGVSNDYIANRNSLLLVDGATVNLDFSGDPDRLRSLIVNGITQPPGLYGGPASGAPNQLPQFTGTGQVLSSLQAVSRKVHGDAGAFDIDLPLTGAPGIECRSGGANGDYQIVLKCASNVTFSNAIVIMGSGHVASTSGSGTDTVTVNVQLANAQLVNVAIYDVNDGTGPTNLIIPIAVLIGDINGNGTVNASDITQVKAQLGPVTAANFRADVNPNGAINASDVIQVKLQLGTSLP